MTEVIPANLDASPAPALPAPQDTAPFRATWLTRALWLLACILLALAHVLLAGYRLGAGNQSIQVAFLKRWINPALYPNDPTVNTIAEYPSYFFQGLACLARYIDVPHLYLALHLFTALLVLAAAYGLGKAMFRDRLAGLVLVGLLFAGHHRALAGDEMYSLGFTHTWAVFPLAIAVLMLLYRNQLALAFLLTGLLFNLHALTAAYLAAMLGFYALLDIRHVRWWKLPLLVALLAIGTLPTVHFMLEHRQVFSADWLWLTYLRSADHSFPSSWWQPGRPDVPRFAILFGLASLSLSFPMPEGHRRKSILLALAVGIMFLAGYVLAESDWVPLNIRSQILRAQLFRSSRLLMVLMFAHIAFAINSGLRMGWLPGLSKLGGALELISAVATGLCVALPPLAPFLPFALVIGTVVAIVNGRLSSLQAIVIGAVMLVVILAWHRIHFVVPLISGELSRQELRLLAHKSAEAIRSFSITSARLDLIFWLAIACGVGLWLVSRLRLGWALRVLVIFEGLAVVWLVGARAWKPLLHANAEDDVWADVQEWAKKNTPADAFFLVPPQPGGFRIHSERACSGEWRDGTQMYFSAGFAGEWWTRMNAVRPDMLLDNPRRHILRSRSLEELSEEQLRELCRKFGGRSSQQYIVLNTDRELNLKEVYTNGVWTVYKPEPAWPAEAVDRRIWQAQDEFLAKVALPNIDKYRKGNLRIEIVDSAGRPVAGEYELRQTRHAFRFGASLPFFQPVDFPAVGDYKPQPVVQQELDRFLEIFNYSLIPFSAKWMYTEPSEGETHYEEVDKYIDWCARHRIGVEYHFLSGLYPMWLRQWLRTASSAEIQKRFLDHSREIVQRYGDRVETWHISNDRYLIDYAPQVISEIRRLYPRAKIGITDCTKFWASPRVQDPGHELYRGLPDVKMLAARGTPIDFFGLHAHSPHGLWPDARTMYQVMDRFAEEGVRVHITEATVPLQSANGIPYNIVGPIRRGTWNAELQADFLERFYTILFSHPAVDVINYWNLGPDAQIPGSGLLDGEYRPKPAFLRLKDLICNRWMTRQNGRVDEPIQVRGFYGEYELAVRLADSKTAKAKLEISPDGRNQYRLKANGTGTLEAVE